MKVILTFITLEKFTSIQHHGDFLYKLCEQFYFSKIKKDVMLDNNQRYLYWQSFYQ